MARVTRAAAVRRQALEEPPPIALLYIGGATVAPELGEQLERIAARYAPLVELRMIAPADVPTRFAKFARLTPTVLVLRRGKLVGEAIGALLPMRELDEVVRCAVEWSR
jgi:hypothetical protein